MFNCINSVAKYKKPYKSQKSFCNWHVNFIHLIAEHFTIFIIEGLDLVMAGWWIKLAAQVYVALIKKKKGFSCPIKYRK